MPSLIPVPQHVEALAGEPFRLDRAVRVACDPTLRPLVGRFLVDVERDTGLVLGGDPGARGVGAEIRLELRPAGRDDELARLWAVEGVSPSGREPELERYGLEIAANRVRLWGPDQEGLFRGLTTLRQLIAGSDGSLAPARILDAPRLAWRGLSVDVARTFLPPAEVERVIDLASLYKLNVLHLHLTDDAGWRLEIPGRPALTEVGARGALSGRAGGYYPVKEFADLVAYGAQRFVTVVPEIDLPGHATAILRSYPELSATGTAPEPVTSPGIFTSAVHLDVEGTDRFLADVLGEVARQTPGPFLHIGGDEALGVDDAAYARFVDEVRSLVRGLGKRVAGWQEIARASVGPDDVVQYWLDRGDEHSAAARDVSLAARKGAGVLMSPSRYAYLDVPYAEPSADPSQEASRQRLGMHAYAPATVREVLAWDPGDLLAELADGAAIAGVEAALWSESVDDAADAFVLMLPRLPGVAERGWSPRGAGQWEEYRDRLAVHSRVWDRRGWGYFRSSLVDWPLG